MLVMQLAPLPIACARSMVCLWLYAFVIIIQFRILICIQSKRTGHRLYLSARIEGAEHNCKEEGGTALSVPTYAEIFDGGSSQIQALGIQVSQGIRFPH